MKINENSILYFSGTGNTYEVSKKVADKCNMNLISVSSLYKEDIIEIDAEVIGIDFPIYYGGMPNIVEKVLDKIKFEKNTYVFSVATYGGIPANPLKLLDNKLKKQNLKLQSGFLIHMPDNYIPAMGAQKESSQQKNFKKANKKVEYISKIVNNREFKSYEKSPYIIDRPFTPLSSKTVKKLNLRDKNFKVDDTCSNCRICEKICPVKNIVIENNKIEWLGNCEQCMACIQYCYREAIQYGDKTSCRKRYRNPNVNYLKVLMSNN